MFVDEVLAVPLAVPAGALPAPPDSPNVIPVSASGAVTLPALATEFIFLPRFAGRAGAQVQVHGSHPSGATAPPRTIADLRAPDGEPVPEGPVTIAGGWFFPSAGDDASVLRSVKLLPGFTGHTVVAAHFDRQQRKFEADGRLYDFAEFAARLRALEGWVRGQPLILISCLTELEAELAEFAELLGSDVLAGTNDVWFTTAGQVVSAPAVVSATGLLTPGQPTGWVRVPAVRGPAVRYAGTLAQVMKTLGTVTGPAGRTPSRDVRFASVGGLGISSLGTGHFAGSYSVRHRSGVSILEDLEEEGDEDADVLTTTSRLTGLTSSAGYQTLRAERELPPGFGLMVNGVRQYPLGDRGRIARLGPAPADDHQAVANSIPLALPERDRGRFGAELSQQVLAFLQDQGSHVFTQRLLEGGLTFAVGTGERRRQITVGLDLGDPATWTHVQETNPEGTPSGELVHSAVEAGHEIISGTRTTVSNQRQLTATADANPAGAGTAKVLTVGGSISGTSGTSYTSGYDIVSAAKRMPLVGGLSVYFDFPGATLRTRIARLRNTPRPPHEGAMPISVRASFPEEMAPRKRNGDPPGVFRDPPRTLRGAVRLGVTQAQLDAEGYGGGPVSEAARQIEPLLTSFFSTPENVGGLRSVRAAVKTRLTAAMRLGAPDPHVEEGVEFALSEQSFLRLWGDLISGAGMVSQLITSSTGKRAFLIVTAKLRNVVAATVDHVPVKEEVQRFVNVADNKTSTGAVSLTLPAVGGNFTLGDPSAPEGGNSALGPALNLNWGPLSVDRSQNANTGSGDIRGLVLHGNSVRYHAEMRLTVKLALENVRPQDMPEVDGDITVRFRISHIQRRRFEHTLRRLTPGLGEGNGATGENGRTGSGSSGSGPPSLAVIVEDVDGPPVTPPPASGSVPSTPPSGEGGEGREPAGPLPMDDEPDEDDPVRYPPEALVAGRGIGFSGVSHLSGAERVLPEIMDLIMGAGAPMAWSRPWTALEFAYLQGRLSSRFTREALTAHASALFQPDGVRLELFRPARKGSEIVTVKVSATLDEVPRYSGRIPEATLEVMPSAFAGNSGGDTANFSIGPSVQFNFMKGTGTQSPSRSAGFSLGFGFGRNSQASTAVESSGFGLEAMLYEGTARSFDSQVSFHIEVQVRHEKGSMPAGWLSLAAAMAHSKIMNMVRNRPGARRPDRRLEASPPARRREIAGSVRFVFPEQLTRRTPVDPADVGGMGRFRGLRRIPYRQPAKQEILPSLTADLEEGGGHVPLNSDDQVMELLGSGLLAQELQRALEDVGMTQASFGDIPFAITGPDYLGSSMVRGPSVIMNTVVKDGLVTDRHATIRIEGYPTSVRRMNPGEPVELFQMHVAEGDGTVSSAFGRGTYRNFSVALAWGLLAGKLGITGQINPSVSYTRSRTRSRTRTRTITPTAGRLTQQTRQYDEYTGDMVWRISVVARDKNMLYRGPVRQSSAVAVVSGGISFLRRLEPAPDPRLQFVILPPAGAVSQIRAATGGTARPNEVRIPVIQATPGSARTLPVQPLIPPSAVSERLFPLPPGLKVHETQPVLNLPPAPSDVTGEGNPLLDAVYELLRPYPKLLEAHWTVEGREEGEADEPDGPRGRPGVSARLRNVLNVGSATMLNDLLLGPGLMLTAPMRSLPLFQQRAQVLLRQRRDPAGQGYQYLSTQQGYNVSRYSFSLNVDNQAWQKETDHGLTASLPVTVSPPPGTPPTFSSLDATPGSTRVSNQTEGGYVQKTKASRNTLFIPGEAYQYAGNVEIVAELTIVTEPSPLLNSVFLTVPRKIASVAQGTGDQRRPLRSVRFWMTERVLIPRDLIRKSTVLPAPPVGAAAIEEVRPWAPLPGARRLNVTQQDISGRRVIALGWDHEKLQVLFDEVAAKLGGTELPVNGQSSAAVRRLLAHGTVSRHALRYMLSYQMLTTQLEFMLAESGLDLPDLIRGGGLLTDTHGKPNMQVRLYNPQLVGYFNGWLESVDYAFAEFNTSQSQAYGSANSGSAAPAVETGKVSGDYGLGLSFQTTRTRSDYAVHQAMPRAEARNRKMPFLRVSADAVITVRLDARNVRDVLNLPGGTVTVSFLVRNALELGVSPEASISLGLRPQYGIPTPSGRIFPHADDSSEVVSAAFSLPVLTSVSALTGALAMWEIHPRDRTWFTITGHYDRVADTFHIGYAYPPGTPFPADFPVAEGYGGPMAFGGGADLTDVEFAAHLWGLFGQDISQAPASAPGRHRPGRYLPGLAFTSSHAGERGPDGRASFAQRVANYLGTRALAASGHVYQTPDGRTWSAEFGLSATGEPLTAGLPIRPRSRDSFLANGTIPASARRRSHPPAMTCSRSSARNSLFRLGRGGCLGSTCRHPVTSSWARSGERRVRPWMSRSCCPTGWWPGRRH